MGSSDGADRATRRQGGVVQRRSAALAGARDAAAEFSGSKTAFAGLAVLVALLTTSLYHNSTQEYPFGSFLRVTLGIADFPFQGRVLVNRLVRGAAGILPVDMYWLLVLTRLAVCLAVIYVLRRLAARLGLRTFTFLPFLLPWAVVFSFWRDYSYPTDFVEILGFGLMLLLTLEGRWPWLVVVFGLSFLNRETAVLFLPFLGLHVLLSDRKRAGFLSLGCCCFLALAFRFFVLPASTDAGFFGDHPLHIQHNLELIRSIPRVFDSVAGESARSFLWRVAMFSGFLYLTPILLGKRLPPALRRYLAVIGPLVLVFAFLFGNLEETRMFYPLLPALIPAGAIVLEKTGRVRTPVKALILVVLGVFVVRAGWPLSAESDIMRKAASFDMAEFKLWKKASYRFTEGELSVRGDRVVVDLNFSGCGMLWIDSVIEVHSGTGAPAPVECRFVLEDDRSQVEPFFPWRRGVFSISRNLRFEMTNPDVQTAKLKRIVLHFDRDMTGELLPAIVWKGFSAGLP